MFPDLSRRDLLKWAGVGGLSADFSLRGCRAETQETSLNRAGPFRASDPPFRAMGAGQRDETGPLRSAINAAIETSRTLILRGRYLVAGPLGDVQIKAKGTLNLHLEGDVEIVVDPDAPAFDTLLFCLTQAPLSSRMTGGTLTLKLNRRCAAGLFLQYVSAEPAGEIDWRASIRVQDALNTAENDTANSYGIFIGGRFRRVAIHRPAVERVGRQRTDGETKALAVVGYTGPVLIDAPRLSVATAPPGNYDVDLLALFPAEDPRGPFHRRKGTAIVRNGLFIDSQGRSIKLQGRAQLSGNRYVRTGKVKAMTESCEVDAQFDQVEEVGAKYEYRRGANGQSPLGRNHLLVSVQHLVRDAAMTTQIGQSEVATEVQLRNAVFVNCHPLSASSTVIISQFSALTLPPLEGAVFSRSLVEIDAAKVSAAYGKTKIAILKANGPLGAMLLGYTSATKSLAGKLEVSITDSRNSGATAALIGSLSGPRVDSASLLRASGNVGWQLPR